MKNKKSFLLITLFLISLFSFISVFIIEITNISSNVDTKIYFIPKQTYMKSSINLLSQIDIYNESKECINSINVDNEYFDIELYFSYITKRSDCTNIISNNFDENTTKGMAIIDIFISPKTKLIISISIKELLKNLNRIKPVSQIKYNSSKNIPYNSEGSIYPEKSLGLA